MNQRIMQSMDAIDQTAKKYHAKVSISAPGQKEVVIADHRPSKKVQDLAEKVEKLSPEGQETVKTALRILTGDQKETIDGLSGLIKNNYPVLQGEKAALKTARAQFKDELLTRPDYRKADDAAKLAKEQLKTAKAHAMADPKVYNMHAAIQVKAQDVKELQLSFSDWLVEWSDQTHANTFDLGYGKPLKIKKTASL